MNLRAKFSYSGHASPKASASPKAAASPKASASPKAAASTTPNMNNVSQDEGVSQIQELSHVDNRRADVNPTGEPDEEPPTKVRRIIGKMYILTVSIISK